jgi:hypothetical protein
MVPGLEELAVDPGLARVLDGYTARVVATKALTVFATTLLSILEREADGKSLTGSVKGQANLPDLDDIISVEDVAVLIGKSRRWIIRNAKVLPFVLRTSHKQYSCSKLLLRKWIAKLRTMSDHNGTGGVG